MHLMLPANSSVAGDDLGLILLPPPPKDYRYVIALVYIGLGTEPRASCMQEKH